MIRAWLQHARWQGDRHQVKEHSRISAESPAGPLSDSPWFWAYLFATAALVALYLASPRYVDRQPQLERQFSARQSGGQAVVGADGPVPPSTSERMILSLRPLYAMFGVLLACAWIGLWYQRFRGRRSAAPPARPPRAED